MADSYANVIQGGNGEVPGIGNVLQGVVGQQLTFGQSKDDMKSTSTEKDRVNGLVFATGHSGSLLLVRPSPHAL